VSNKVPTRYNVWLERDACQDYPSSRFIRKTVHEKENNKIKYTVIILIRF